MSDNVPCELCGTNAETGTKRCDRCWELEGRIQSDPGLAAQILNATGKAVVLGGDDLRKALDGARREERARIADRLDEQADEEKRTQSGDCCDANVPDAFRGAAELVRSGWDGLADYEPGQRHPTGITGEDHAETDEAKWSKPWSMGDALYHEGVGIEVSKHRINDWTASCEKAVRANEIPEYPGRTFMERGLISEGEILQHADRILVSRAMKSRLHLKR